MINVTHIMKYLKTLAIAAGVFLLLAFSLFFIFRNTLLNTAIRKADEKLYSRLTMHLHIGEATFEGIAGIRFTELSVTPDNKDTLLRIQTLKSTLRIWPLFTGRVRLQSVFLENGFLQWSKSEKDTQSIVSANEPKSKDDQSETTSPNYAKRIYKLIDMLFDATPDQLTIRSMQFRITEPKNKLVMNWDECILNDNQLQAYIRLMDDTVSVPIRISGKVDLSEKTADVTMTSEPNMSIPYLTSKFNLQLGFLNASLSIREISLNNNELTIDGSVSMSRLRLNHPKIAMKDVLLPDAKFVFHYTVGENYLMLDSSSVIEVQQLKVHPFVKLETATDTIARLSVVIPRVAAQSFVNALPEGLFNHIRGMEVKGEFDYRLDFVYNENKPLDLIFESKLNKYNLAITRYGEANLGKLNDSFVYTPKERGRAVRSFVVGPENPYYTPIDRISPYLKTCVLTTEDPSFFYHRGFIDEAFRQSIVKNIRTRKFARGASTLSMQLVKNVFLSREKTLSRKLEEILLVYIIENNHISSKERMLEVYFNIIEWGPNVYGIGEAAEFYFTKKPDQLNLSECLFLATIIPRPKGFMWRFDKLGKQKEFVGRQYKFLSDLMVRRNVLVPEDTVGINYQIPITGRAKEFIKITVDTVPETDILLMDENGRVRPVTTDDE